MTTPHNPSAGQPGRPEGEDRQQCQSPTSSGELGAPPVVGGQLEALSQQEIAALRAAGVLDVAAHDADPEGAVPITGWRVPDLAQPPAFGPAFHGLTPRLAAVLVTRYSQPGQLVLDLTADLAVEGVAGAGARRYVRLHPTAVGVLADARRRGDWPLADLVLLRWPPQPTAQPGQPEPGPGLTLLSDCRELLDPSGHLIVVVSLGRATDHSEHTRATIATARKARLRFQHRHLVVSQPAPERGGETPAHPQPQPWPYVALLVFSRGDGDDD